MKINSFERYEKKYVISKEKANRIIKKLEEYTLYDEHCNNGKFYTIYNLYFDNDNYDIVRNSVSSPVFKEKMRLRCYKKAKENELVFLEIKRKTNKKVTKRRVMLTLKEAFDFVDKRIKPIRYSYLENQIINELDYYLSVYKTKPKLFICYDRIAMFSKEDESLRITFDFNLRERETNLTLEDVNGDLYLDDNTYIMEVKVTKGLPLWFVKILSEEEVYSQGFSKYGYYYTNKRKEELNYV